VLFVLSIAALIAMAGWFAHSAYAGHGLTEDDLEDAVDEAIAETLEEVRVCLNAAKTLDQARACDEYQNEGGAN
jgi:hypothetical protein